jgi:hypothetical protein
MRSGLVSSVELFLDLLDERERVRAGNRLTLRLAFDLWEEVFSVEEGGQRRRLADAAELASYLGTLPPLPVAPLSALEPGGRYRVRVGLRLHAIAPGERERVEDAIAGVGGGQRGPPGGVGQSGPADPLLLPRRSRPAATAERDPHGLVPARGADRCIALGHA